VICTAGQPTIILAITQTSVISRRWTPPMTMTRAFGFTGVSRAQARSASVGRAADIEWIARNNKRIFGTLWPGQY